MKSDLQLTYLNNWFVDLMSDEFQDKYGYWPAKYYLFKGTSLLYVGEPTNNSDYYDVQDIIRKVKELASSI